MRKRDRPAAALVAPRETADKDGGNTGVQSGAIPARLTRIVPEISLRAGGPTLIRDDPEVWAGLNLNVIRCTRERIT